MLLIWFFGCVYAFAVLAEVTRANVAVIYGAKITRIKWWPHRHHGHLYACRIDWDWPGMIEPEARQMVYFSPVVTLLPMLFIFGYLGTWRSFAMLAAAVVVFLHELWSDHLMSLRVFPKSFAAITTLGVAVLAILALGLVVT